MLSSVKLRALVLAGALWCGVVPGGLGAPSAACAGASAALVVDLGERGDVFRYCVSLPQSSVTGIELIQLASEQHGLQYSLGFGGGAVCQLQGVGPEGDDCFAEYPDFWGYWHGDGAGGWGWAGTGAGSYRVESGDVEGWSWGSGQDGSSHPAPPASTYASVCGAPPPDGEGSGGEARGGSSGKPGGAAGGGSGGTSGAGARSSTAEGDSAADGRAADGGAGASEGAGEAAGTGAPARAGGDAGGDTDKRARRGGTEPGPRDIGGGAAPSPPLVARQPAAASPAGTPGIPVVAWTAIVAAGAMIVAGGVLVRRRRTA